MSSGALKSRTSSAHRAANLKALQLNPPSPFSPTRHKNLEMSLSSSLGAFETINDKVLRELNERTANAKISSGDIHTGPKMRASFKQHNIFDGPSSQSRPDSKSRGAHTLQSVQSRSQASQFTRAGVSETISRMQRLARRAERSKMVPRPMSGGQAQSEQASPLSSSFSTLSSPLEKPSQGARAQNPPIPALDLPQCLAAGSLDKRSAPNSTPTASLAQPSTPAKPFRFSSHVATPLPKSTPRSGLSAQRHMTMTRPAPPISSNAGIKRAHDLAASAPAHKRARVCSNRENTLPSYARPTVASSRRELGGAADLADALKSQPLSQMNRMIPSSKSCASLHTTGKPNASAVTPRKAAAPARPATLAVPTTPVQRGPANLHLVSSAALSPFRMQIKGSGNDISRGRNEAGSIDKVTEIETGTETGHAKTRSSQRLKEFNLPPQESPVFVLRRSPRLAAR